MRTIEELETESERLGEIISSTTEKKSRIDKWILLKKILASMENGR